jgi:hypothetical protein
MLRELRICLIRSCLIFSHLFLDPFCQRTRSKAVATGKLTIVLSLLLWWTAPVLREPIFIYARIFFFLAFDHDITTAYLFENTVLKHKRVALHISKWFVAFIEA